MLKFIAGFVLGVVFSTIGFSGVARLLDKGVTEIQTQTKELAK